MTILSHFAATTLIGVLFTMSPAHAKDLDPSQLAAIQPGSAHPVYHDLVFGVADGQTKPFYMDGTFMLGDKLIKVEQGAVPGKKLASFDPQSATITVSNDTSVAEADKGAAVLELMDAMSINAIETAAGH